MIDNFNFKIKKINNMIQNRLDYIEKIEENTDIKYYVILSNNDGINENILTIINKNSIDKNNVIANIISNIECDIHSELINKLYDTYKDNSNDIIIINNYIIIENTELLNLQFKDMIELKNLFNIKDINDYDNYNYSKDFEEKIKQIQNINYNDNYKNKILFIMHKMYDDFKIKDELFYSNYSNYMRDICKYYITYCDAIEKLYSNENIKEIHEPLMILIDKKYNELLFSTNTNKQFTLNEIKKLVSDGWITARTLFINDIKIFNDLVHKATLILNKSIEKENQQFIKNNNLIPKDFKKFLYSKTTLN